MVRMKHLVRTSHSRFFFNFWLDLRRPLGRGMRSAWDDFHAGGRGEREGGSERFRFPNMILGWSVANIYG